MAAQSSWFSCSPKKQLEEAVVEPQSATAVTTEASKGENKADTENKDKTTTEETKTDKSDAAVAPASAPKDAKALKEEKKKQEQEAKAKAEEEKKQKKEAEKEAKKVAKEAKEKEKKDAEAKKKAEKEQKAASKSAKGSPVVAAAAAAAPPPAEVAAPAKQDSSDQKVSEVVEPTPAVIAQAEAVAPQSEAAAAKSTAKLNKSKSDLKSKHDLETNPKEAEAAPATSTEESDDKKEKTNILQSIASIFKKKDDAKEDEAVLPFANQKMVFVLGGPGSGKGTQCARIKEKYSFDHISAGDLLRHEVSLDTEQGKQIAEMIKDGQIVPVEITLALLKADLEKRKSAKGFLIDGFPRQIDQATSFEASLRAPDLILFFECPESILEGRLLKRGETSGRADDNAESIRKRFQVFAEVSSKCIDHYEKEGKVKMLKVDASGEESAVWEAVQAGFTANGMD